jgi:cyanophycinase-like exopeptidase
MTSSGAGNSRELPRTCTLGSCSSALPPDSLRGRAPREAPFTQDSVRSGDLVIIGGGLGPTTRRSTRPILDGRSGDGPLCVIPTASAEPESSMESAVTRFDELGGPGTALGILLTVDNPEDAWLPEVAEQIRSCSGFFFTGGVQTRIVQVFRPEEGDSPCLPGSPGTACEPGRW